MHPAIHAQLERTMWRLADEVSVPMSPHSIILCHNDALMRGRFLPHFPHHSFHSPFIIPAVLALRAPPPRSHYYVWSTSSYSPSSAQSPAKPGPPRGTATAGAPPRGSAPAKPGPVLSRGPRPPRGSATAGARPPRGRACSIGRTAHSPSSNSSLGSFPSRRAPEPSVRSTWNGAG